MKFRPVRELLEEAMSECIDIPRSIDSLADKLHAKPEDISLIHQGYDDRIRWDSYLVLANGSPVGYVDGLIHGVKTIEK